MLPFPSEHELSDVAGITKRSSDCFALVEQKLRNSFVLHIFFNSNSRGSHQAHIHLPKSHVESFVLCVREEMAGEVMLKIKTKIK